MIRRQSLISLGGMLLPILFSAGASAQTPTAYSVTMGGTSSAMKIYRDGSNALIEHGASGQPNHMRTLFDLALGKSLTWNPDEAAAGCSIGGFSGDWGDPFKDAASTNEDLAKQGVKETGVETIHGMPAKVFEAPIEGGKVKAWIDTKTGLVLKLEMTPANGPTQTLAEITDVSLAKPAASVFALPAWCKEAANTPLPPSEGDRFAAETGGAATDFVNAVTAPSSQNSCTVLFKAVNAGSMQPIGGYKISVDNVARTAELRNGVLRIENAPANFNVDLTFPNAGSSAMIHRQCPLPQTVLLMVVKNPSNLGEGADWLWVKSGKYAK